MLVVHLTATDRKIVASSASAAADLFNSKENWYDRENHMPASFSVFKYRALEKSKITHHKCLFAPFVQIKKWLYWCEVQWHTHTWNNCFLALWNQHRCGGAMKLSKFSPTQSSSAKYSLSLKKNKKNVIRKCVSIFYELSKCTHDIHSTQHQELYCDQPGYSSLYQGTHISGQVIYDMDKHSWSCCLQLWALNLYIEQRLKR